VKPAPPGWPRISSSIFYEDASAAITWLCNAFGFELRLKVEGENGRIEHSELSFGDDGLIMVGHATRAGETPARPYQAAFVSPRAVEGRQTQTLALFVDDVDAHHERAVAAGARLVRPLETNDFGPDYWSDRSYGCTDPEGHIWWFMQRLRNQQSSEK
jgi:uncharacterized glyoxalase superfamily protein PhnB